MDNRTLTYDDSISWLFNLQFFGIKLGLDNIRALAAAWGNPERRYPVVHVAGTNGKGSTASFIASALQAAGYRTGLYTSPHLVDFTERIRIDGQPILRDAVAEYACRLRPDIDRLNATFFEATTLMAFQHFADQGVDVAVIETGLGGRLDATNIVQPVLTVITSLSLEHREHLGESIEEIAKEKAGIIKPGVPLIAVEAVAPAKDVLIEHCHRFGAEAHIIRPEGEILAYIDIDGMDCRLPEFSDPVRIALIGRHQVENARLAVQALRLLSGLGFGNLTDDCIRDGLREVRRRSGVRGRLERLQTSPELVVDVGHNPSGISAMLESWSAVRDPAATALVFGVLKHKDLVSIFSVLKRFSPCTLTLVEADSHEAQSLPVMQKAARDAGVPAMTAEHVDQAVRESFHRIPCGSTLLFGSHYVVGSFLRGGTKK